MSTPVSASFEGATSCWGVGGAARFGVIGGPRRVHSPHLTLNIYGFQGFQGLDNPKSDGL